MFFFVPKVLDRVAFPMYQVNLFSKVFADVFDRVSDHVILRGPTDQLLEAMFLRLSVETVAIRESDYTPLEPRVFRHTSDALETCVTLQPTM